jgi:protein-L-isoaspartate O-methyltransferase
MHALTLEVLREKLHTAKKALDIGTGSGYMTLAMAKVLIVKKIKNYI